MSICDPQRDSDIVKTIIHWYNYLTQVFQYASSSQPKWRVYVWGVAEHGALGVNLQLKKSRKPISYLQKPVRTHFAEQHKVKIVSHQYSGTRGLLVRLVFRTYLVWTTVQLPEDTYVCSSFSSGKCLAIGLIMYLPFVTIFTYHTTGQTA
jgi:hypothetical protein